MILKREDVDLRQDTSVNYLKIQCNNKLTFVSTSIYRVATAQGKQGKQGIWFLLFPDRENTGNFTLTQGKFLRHRENMFL